MTLGTIERAPAGLPVGARHRRGTAGDALGEGAERLVGQAVVVLDQVDPAQGQAVGERRQRLGAKPHRLDRGAEERPVRHAKQGAQPGLAEPRPPQGAAQGLGQFDAHQPDAGLEADVAEQAVEELGQVAGGHLGRIANDGLPAVFTDPIQRDDLPDDLVADGRALDQVLWELHRLLDTDIAGARLGLGRGGGLGDVVDGGDMLAG